MISTGSSINSDSADDGNFQNSRVSINLEILQQLLKDGFNGLDTKRFLPGDIQTLKEYEYHLRRIEELLLRLEHEKSNSENASEIGKSNSDINSAKMLQNDKLDFKIPCTITSSCVCGKRNESKITKIFPAFKKKDQISKSSLNTENQFSQISSATNLESSSCKCTENESNPSINIKISMNADDANSSLKFSVEVPSRVLEELKCRDAKIKHSESLSTISKSPKAKSSRLKSVFLKLLQNKRRKSCTSASGFSSEIEIPKNPIQDRNTYNSFPSLSEFSQINIVHRTSDVLNPNFCNSDAEQGNETTFEKRLHLNKPERKRSDSRERKLALAELYSNFLENQINLVDKLNLEKGNLLSCCPKCGQKEIPIEVKTTKFPPFQKKSYHGDNDKTGNLREEVLDKYSTDNDRFKSKSRFFEAESSVRRTSTFEYFLQNFKDFREKREVNLRQPAEKDWHQILSTRQLSKISLCSLGNCSCSLKDEYDSEVIEITEVDPNLKSDIKLSITEKLQRLAWSIFGK